jgi:hypothetical protein
VAELSHYITYSLIDYKGEKSSTRVKCPTGLDLADLGLFAIELGKLMIPLINGNFAGISYTINLDLADLGSQGEITSGADVEEGARFSFDTAEGLMTTLRIPTFDEALIDGNTRNVDTADTDVAAFITAMTDGIDLVGVGGSGTVQPSNVHGSDISALSKALENFVSGRRY